MLDIVEEGDALIVKILEPELQMYLIPQFRSAIDAVLAKEPKRVVFDFTMVNHLDSSAMGAMFHFQRHMQEAGGKVVLINVSKHVMQIFKITKSDGHLTFCASLSEALKK